MSVKIELTLPHDAPQAAIVSTPLAAKEPAISPVNSPVLSATDEAVESLFAVALLR